MILTALFRAGFNRMYGPIPDRTAGGDALVLVADGVGGFDLCGLGLQFASAQAGGSREVRVCRWGHGPWRWFADLTNVENRDRQAGAMAEEARRFRDEHPGSTVSLVGKSGGTGVVVRALESLEPDAVEAAVLLAPAISPRYDLSRALRAVRREMVVYWSPLDAIILGLGTSLFGTIDRVRTPSAGLIKFRPPKGLDGDALARYGKLRQVCWSPSMARAGYFGGHLGVDHPAFLRRYVVPILDP
ncbi:MAG: alpha/beta hydrolase [Isosphaeraceae bacterium]